MLEDRKSTNEVLSSAKGCTAYSGQRVEARSFWSEVRDTALPVPEEVRVWFHRTVAIIFFLAKRARPELLTAVSYLAARVTKCDGDDVDKLIRLVNYLRGTREMGMELHPGESGNRVHLFVDASYGRAFTHEQLRGYWRPGCRTLSVFEVADHH
jgi:hypothetical protein